MDLAAWWQARRWVALLELIDQLPAASRLQEAVSNDPEAARQIAFSREFGDRDREVEPWSPRLSQYDLHAQLLRELINVTASAAAQRDLQLIPPPRTEVERQAELLEQFLAARAGMRWGFDESDFT